MGMMPQASMRVRDDRAATEKASNLASKASSLLARACDLNRRLGSGADIKANAVDKLTGYDAPPAPMPLLHDSLDEASATLERINEMLDIIGQRL